MSKVSVLRVQHKDGVSTFQVSDASAVSYDEQSKTAAQKKQAQENIGAAKSSIFYASLADAIAEENAVTDSASPVEVFTAENGEKIVRLLADVSESTQIDISKDMTLVLNGHTLSLTAEGAQLVFAAGTNCKINGEVAGSAIKKENITSTGNLSTVLVYGDLRVCGGYYSVGGSLTGITKVFGIGPACNVFELDGVELVATNTSTDTTKATKTVQSQALHTIIKNSTATAEAQRIIQNIHVQAEGTLDIENSTITATSAGSVIDIYPSKCKAVIKDSTITATSDNTANGICPISGANVKIENSHISASGYTAHGIQTVSSDTIITATNSVIFADAHSGHVEQSYAIGITSSGVLVCIDTDVTGPHSAVQTSGDIFVKGGTFSGYTHGGFYFVHDAGNKAYINNAVMRFGVYEGSFEDFSAGAYAGFYMGDSDFTSLGISVYMDGCTIEGEGNEPFVVRSGAEGYTNTLYISNTVNNSTASTIRLNKDQTTNRAEMKIGRGCNFTPANTSDPQWAEETGKLYRRMKEDISMDGRDFAALLAYAEAQNT